MAIEDTAEFLNWFGASKVVDASGKPLLVYHGTAIPKSTFRREGGGAGVGAYFTLDRTTAEDYAEMDASIDGDDPIVMEVYLAIRNPYRATGTESQSISAERRDELEAQGYDGVIGEYPDGLEYVVFHPEQIKIVSSVYMREKPASSDEQGTNRSALCGERG